MEAPASEVWMWVMEESRVHIYLGVAMLLGATSGPLETALKHPLYPVSVAQPLPPSTLVIPPSASTMLQAAHGSPEAPAESSASELSSTSGTTYSPPTTTECNIYIYLRKSYGLSFTVI